MAGFVCYKYNAVCISQDVDAETLAEMTTQYNVEISELRARNTELSNTIACQHDLHAEV